MLRYANVPPATTDRYIAEAQKIIERERTEIQLAAKKERHERELSALQKIPTPSEIILKLLAELDIKNPVATGFEFRVLNNVPQQIPRFASEAHRQFLLKTLLTFSIEMSRSASETNVEDDDLIPLTDEQLRHISEIINK